MADKDCMDGGTIALIVFIVIFVIAICVLIFSGTQTFKNLTYTYNLPVVGTVPNLQIATVPRMMNLGNGFNIPSSSEEPPTPRRSVSSSEEPAGSEEPSSREVYSVYSDQSVIVGMYSNERKNMNPFGDYKLVSSMKKQEAKEIDNLFQRLQNASNSGFLQ